MADSSGIAFTKAATSAVLGPYAASARDLKVRFFSTLTSSAGGAAFFTRDREGLAETGASVSDRRATASSNGAHTVCSCSGVSSPIELSTRPPCTAVLTAAHPASPEMCLGATAMAAIATASSDSRARLFSAACSSDPDDSRSRDHRRDSDSHCGALIHFRALAKRSTMGGNPSACSGGMTDAKGA